MGRVQGPIQFVMQRKAMLGIKQRAEGTWSPSPIEVVEPLLWLLAAGVLAAASVRVLVQREQWWRPFTVAGGKEAQLGPRFAYFYLMADDPDRVRATIPRHVAHWRDLGLTGYLGGPFADRTGGLITFQADDDQQAKRAVDSDPFVQEGLLKAHWLKQWIPQ